MVRKFASFRSACFSGTRIMMVRSLARPRKSRGRPPTGAQSVHLRIPPDQYAAINAWIKLQKEPDLSRPEAIRRLVELGLKAKGK